MLARLASAINTEVYEIESENMEPPVQTSLQTENISLFPIGTMYAFSDGTVLCSAGYAQGSMWLEHTSVETIGLSSTK